MRTSTHIALCIGLLAAAPLAAQAGDAYTWARVLDAQPVYQQVRIPERENVCWDEQVYRKVPERRSAAPAILGAILGGVIGHQVGDGRGRDIATVAGAALGASVATQEQYRRYPERYYSTTEQRCETRTSWRHEDRVVAWDVDYEIYGEVHQARLREQPGDRIRVRVGVQPVDG